ncbi:hypothetical protein FS594_26855 (plasmid) [Rahnella aquatilis]|uniref:Uncharacterized protein n=1 Tax=Rahnella perminowiae TaxID=2816244 RepID=A0ABS6KVP0_9GAMM|nr:hypothetical protein [Rahnella perminowiae]MBU9833561.1 hypothetical protein [Rahnella perminowiae]UJD92376.1 hypothetical protein FS594_26855 [Rahnella aquatilis]
MKEEVAPSTLLRANAGVLHTQVCCFRWPWVFYPVGQQARPDKRIKKLNVVTISVIEIICHSIVKPLRC